jgi:hypothetical protein
MRFQTEVVVQVPNVLGNVQCVYTVESDVAGLAGEPRLVVPGPSSPPPLYSPSSVLLNNNTTTQFCLASERKSRGGVLMCGWG